MEILYTLKFQRSYQSLMNVLYIIGVSKQNIQTTYLNKISLKNFYEKNISMSKNRIKEIFEKINKISDNEVKYEIDGGYVYFSSGFEVAQDEKFYSEEKKKFDKIKKEEEILNSFLEENKQINVTPKIEKPVAEEKNEDEELLEYKPSVFPDDNVDALHLGDENLSKELVLNYIEELNSKSQIIEFKQENVQLFRTFEKQLPDLQKLKASSSKPSDICIVYHGDYLQGNDWQERKNTAEENIRKIQNKVLKSLTKLYEKDKKIYKVLLNYICKNYPKLFNF